MKRLYKAEATVTVYLVAEDESEARDAAGDAVAEEIRNNGEDGVSSSPTVREVHDPSQIDSKWRGTEPLNQDGTYMTCEEVLESQAEDE